MTFAKLVSAAAASIVLTIALPAAADNSSAGSRAQSSDSADVACKQAKQFAHFMRNLAMTDGNLTGYPYDSQEQPEACTERGRAATVKRVAEEASAKKVYANNANDAANRN